MPRYQATFGDGEVINLTADTDLEAIEWAKRLARDMDGTALDSVVEAIPPFNTRPIYPEREPRVPLRPRAETPENKRERVIAAALAVVVKRQHDVTHPHEARSTAGAIEHCERQLDDAVATYSRTLGEGAFDLTPRPDEIDPEHPSLTHHAVEQRLRRDALTYAETEVLLRVVNDSWRPKGEPVEPSDWMLQRRSEHGVAILDYCDARGNGRLHDLTNDQDITQ